MCWRFPHIGWDRLPLLPLLPLLGLVFHVVGFGGFVLRALGCIFGVARIAGLRTCECTLYFYKSSRLSRNSGFVLPTHSRKSHPVSFPLYRGCWASGHGPSHRLEQIAPLSLLPVVVFHVVGVGCFVLRIFGVSRFAGFRTGGCTLYFDYEFHSLADRVSYSRRTLGMYIPLINQSLCVGPGSTNCGFLGPRSGAVTGSVLFGFHLFDSLEENECRAILIVT